MAQPVAPLEPPAPQQGAPVPVVGPDGSTYLAPPDKVQEALQSGYHLQDPREALREQVTAEEEAKGTAGSLEAAGKSALNQLLFGVPGIIAEHGETPEQKARRELVEEYHSTGRLLGGAAGLGASMLLGGGLFKGIGAAGEAVGHLISPAEAAAEAGLGARMAATAANYATQGALVASPQAIAQAALGDPKQAAETLLWGVGLGAVLGGGGELLSSAAKAGAERVGEALTGKAAEDFAVARTVKAVGGERSQINKLSPEWRADVATFAHEEGLIQPGMTRREVGSAIDAAQEKYGARLSEVIDSLDGLVEKGAKDQDLASLAIKPGEIGDKLMAEFNTPEMHMPMNAPQRAALEMVVESANRIPTKMINGREVVAFEDAQKFVSSLRQKWVNGIKRAENEGGVKGLDVVTPLDRMKADAYFVARDVVHQAGDRVADAGSPALKGELAKAKLAYAKVAELDKWAATREAQEAGNRMVGLTDFLHMGHGIASGVTSGAGAAIGGALGGGAGALVGSALGRAAGIPLDYIAKHWLEDKGLVYLSSAAHRAAKEGPEVFSTVIGEDAKQRLEATLKTVSMTVRNMATRGIIATQARTQEHMKALLGSTVGLTPDQSYDKLSKRLTDLQANPEALTNLTSTLAAPYRSVSEDVSDEYQRKLVDAFQYLYDSLPKPSAPPAPFTPQMWHPSASDKMAFHDKAEIVANPARALAHVETGTLSAAHLDALQRIYPVIYDAMRAEFMKEAALHQDLKLPPAERASVAMFLQAPLGASTDPANLKILQSVYIPTGPPGGQGGQKPPPKERTAKLDDMPSLGSAFLSTMTNQEPGT